MQIAACQSYHAVTSSVEDLRMPDGKSVFKIYYISIIGRDKPNLYEWGHCTQTKEDFKDVFLSQGYAGIGFVTAFPHITKVFRFAPSIETVIDIGEFDTVDMKRCDCSRGDGYHEFACYAEAVIAAEEYHAWARATSVDDYLAFQCKCTDFLVTSTNKLSMYWKS